MVVRGSRVNASVILRILLLDPGSLYMGALGLCYFIWNVAIFVLFCVYL